MSDEDRAQEVELKYWEMNNQPRPGRIKYKPIDPEYGPERCGECDDDMPPERREYGFHICMSCKRDQENRVKRGL